MTNKYKITSGEVNEVVLNSPYVLADSPANLGQRAKQIKKYFYNFIYTLAEKINLHLEEINNAITSCEALISDLEKKDTELGNSIPAQVSTHNQAQDAHLDIRAKISELVNGHNQSALSHKDLREKILSLEKITELNYALSSGKSRVYTFDDTLEMLEFINGGNIISLGDILLIADPHSPDFTVFEIDSEKREGDIELSYEAISSGEIVPEAERSYFISSIRLISTNGNLETSRLAKKEELESLEDELYEYIERTDDTLACHTSELLGKENAIIKEENSEGSVEILTNHEYNLGLRGSISLTLSSSSGIESILNFISGESPTTIDAPSELIFQGDDTLNGVFYPISHRIYEINIKDVLGVLIARVLATDYEVME